MGTKVQCKNYQHGFCSMRDINEVNNSRALYHENDVLSGQFHGASKQRPINGYTAFDKEMLRKTILSHEATFRKQVHELHRLYSIQRKLMDELKRKDQRGHSFQGQTMLSSPFSSHMPQKDVAKEFTWTSSLPALSAGYSTPFVNGADSSALAPTERIGTLSEPLKSESRKSSKILIDLQIPAEAYSDNEIADNTNDDLDDRSKRLLDLNDDPEPENAAKIMCANEEDPACRKGRKVDLQLENGTDSHSIVDLNEPVEEVCYAKAGVPSLSNPSDSRSLHEMTQHNLPFKLDSTVPNQNCLFQNNSCEASRSCFLQMNEKEEILGRQFSGDQLEHLQNGKSICSPNSFNRRRMSSSPDQLKLHNDLSWSSLSSQNNASSWLKDRLPTGNEHRKLSDSTNSRISAPSTSGSFSTIPRFHSHNIASTSDSSCWKSVDKISDIPNDVQTLPLLGQSVPSHEGSRTTNDKWKHSNSLRSQQNPRNEVSYKNGFPHDSQLDSRAPSNLCSSKFENDESFHHGKLEDVGNKNHLNGPNFMVLTSAKDFTSNPLSTNGYHDVCANQQSCFDDSNGGLSWLMSTQACNRSSSLNGAVRSDQGSGSNHSQMMSNNGVVSGSGEAVNDSFKDVLHSRDKKNEVSGISNYGNHVGISCIDLNLKYNQAPNMPFEENSGNVIWIDVNSEAPSLDQPDLSVSNLVGTTVSGKATSEIDLEAPIFCHSNENMPTKGPLRTNHPLSTFDVARNSMEITRECKPYLETARTAAEIIVSLSGTTLTKNSSSTSSQWSHLTSEDTLYWFADVVTSDVENPETAGSTLREDENGSSEHDGMDFFESMTLRLTETKAEDFWSRPLVPEHQKEGSGVASLLLPKIKRGQMRRRRQKRDFQKDILPGLATLSRYEVTEDLQTIGGLMRASGQSWQMGSGKRSTGRNWRSCRGRGRGAQGATTSVEIPADKPPSQSNNEFENNGSNIIGWGRTRRCRRQRYPGTVAMHPPLT